MHSLELIGVKKTFSDKIAVHTTDLCLENGIYGLLGENGAGKTTLMRMICGILSPTEGQIRCDRIEIRQMGAAYRRFLGYLPQDFGYYEDFSARRFLNYIAALKALPKKQAAERIEELLELTGLTKDQNRPLRTYSGGMLRRIGIVQALLNDPEILILDEPTAGLDPGERVRFRNIISSLGRNRIILLSTHIVSDVNYIADQILVMKDGKIIKKGTEPELSSSLEQIVWACRIPDHNVDKFTDKFIVSNIKYCEEGAELRIVSAQRPTPDSISLKPSLEDIYLYLTRKKEEEK